MISLCFIELLKEEIQWPGLQKSMPPMTLCKIPHGRLSIFLPVAIHRCLKQLLKQKLPTPTQIKKSNNHVSPRSLLCPTISGSIQPGMQWKQANSCSCACPTYLYCRMVSFLMDQLFVYKYIRYQSRWRTSQHITKTTPGNSFPVVKTHRRQDSSKT